MIRKRPLITAVGLTASFAMFAACGGSKSDYAGPAPDITQSATPSNPGDPASVPTGVQVIKVTIDADSVQPNGTRIKVKRNVPVLFDITAVQDGELHAHSTPGQELKYLQGTSTGSLVFDQPGIIDVEDHRLNKLIVQLEVR